MLRRAFQYAVHAIKDLDYPGTDRAWIEQTLRKLEWVKEETNGNEVAMTLVLLEDVIKASDTTIEKIRSVFGDDITDLLQQVLLDIDTAADTQDIFTILNELQQAPEIVKTVKLISLIVHVDNYRNDRYQRRDLNYLDNRLMMIDSLRISGSALQQEARHEVHVQRANYRLSSALS